VRKLVGDINIAARQWMWLMKDAKDPLYPTANLYFGGATTVDGLLDFMIWKRQADQLGIQLTDQDIAAAVRDETRGYLTGENDRDILQALAREGLGDPNLLLHALGEEFRVRLAQASLVGYDPDGIVTPPAPVTPYELYNYYVGNRTEVSVQMLPIKVSKFVPAVKEKPTNEELQNLYNKYKDDLPAPEKDTPGFKQARQVKVAWIDFSPTGQAFRDEARKLLLAQIASTVTNPAMGAAVAAPFLKAYETATRSSTFERTWGDPQINRLNSADFPLTLATYKDVQKPDTIASTIALAAGGNAFGAVLTVPDRAYAREWKAIAPFAEQETRRRMPVAAAFLAGATSFPSALGIANTWVAASWEEQYVPPALMGRQLLKDVEAKLAEVAARNSETAFREGLDKIRKETGGRKGKFETAAAEYAKKELAAHKWPHGSSKRMGDVYDVAQDDGLQPLKEAYVVSHSLNDPKAKKFGEEFFFTSPMTRQETKVYTPESMFQGDKTFLYWTTEDTPAKVLSFDAVKKKVEDAWYLQKARPLAEEAAEKIAEQARKSGSPVQTLTEAAKGQALVQIDGIARQTRVPSASPQMSEQYQAYAFPDDKVEHLNEVRSRAGAALNKILALKQTGDVTVFSDLPKDTYYVAAVTHRNEPLPTSFEFRQGGLLTQSLQPERQDSYRRAILDQLRTQAHLEVFPEGKKNAEQRGSNQQDQDQE
jgi:hypothetical protein